MLIRLTMSAFQISLNGGAIIVPRVYTNRVFYFIVIFDFIFVRGNIIFTRFVYALKLDYSKTMCCIFYKFEVKKKKKRFHRWAPRFLASFSFSLFNVRLFVFIHFVESFKLLEVVCWTFVHICQSRHLKLLICVYRVSISNRTNRSI